MPSNSFCIWKKWQKQRTQSSNIEIPSIGSKKKFAVDINPHMKRFGDIVKVEIKEDLAPPNLDQLLTNHDNKNKRAQTMGKY